MNEIDTYRLKISQGELVIRYHNKLNNFKYNKSTRQYEEKHFILNNEIDRLNNHI